MQYQCPQCPKTFTKKSNLDAHIKRLHSTAQPATQPATQGNKFEVKKPAEKKQEAATYYCQDCGAVVTKGQSSCPGCGEALNWSGL